MRLASLGSGSKGNATIVECGTQRILIDCGFSLAQFEKRLQRLSLRGDDIDAVLVTHEHSDHGSGVARVAQKYRIPLYMTVGTARSLKPERFEIISGGQQLVLGDQVQVRVVTVPHDAEEPVQFVFTENGSLRRLGILTDSGHVTSHMMEAYNDLHGLLLEFNYDEEMLNNGPYPPSLKRRISGGFGHLSNRQSADLLKQIKTTQMDCLIAGHLSEKNNSPDIVSSLLTEHEVAPRQLLACQQQGFAWVAI